MPTKLLLADDSATIQRVIGLTFATEDVQVIVAGDGDEAIARISADRPDIVLADIGMPKRTGYEVSAFVKNHPELRHVPVILLAGAFDPVDDVRAREAKCDGVLVKPFEPQQVIATVRELVGRSHVGLPAAVTIDTRAGGATEDGMVLDAALDDYFDKIDRTFGQRPIAAASMPQGSTSDLGMHTFDEPIVISDFSAPLPELSKDLPLSMEHDTGSYLRVDDVAPGITLDDLITATTPAPAAHSLAAIDLNAIEIPVDLLSPEVSAKMPDAAPFERLRDSVELPTPAPVPPPASGRNLVAHAFSALLAAEQGEPWAVPPRLSPGAPPSPAVTDALVDEVSRRVFDRLSGASDDDLSGVVRRIVSEVAERLVREEIDRIRNRHS